MARRPIHPGEHLAEELKALDVSAAMFALALRVPTKQVAAVLSGEGPITDDMALRLGHYFGTSSEFWVNLQVLYDRRLAERTTSLSRPRPSRSTRRRSASATKLTTRRVRR